MRQIASVRVVGADGSVVQMVKSPSIENRRSPINFLNLRKSATKNGNGLYLEIKAIAGTMPHRKSEPRIALRPTAWSQNGAEARCMS